MLPDVMNVGHSQFRYIKFEKCISSDIISAFEQGHSQAEAVESEMVDYSMIIIGRRIFHSNLATRHVRINVCTYWSRLTGIV